MLLLKINRKKGFTLIELAISILIISLLMSGVFSITNGSILSSKSATTNQKLNTIYKAIGSFVATNKRLPCPASIEVTVDSNDFGKEVGRSIIPNFCYEGGGVYISKTHNNLLFGGVPFRSLNLSSDFAGDEYGNRFIYFIDQKFANPGDFSTSSASNIMTVYERQSSGNVTLTSDAIMIILSYGPNLFGGFDTKSAVQNSILTTDSDESSNIVDYGTFDLFSPPRPSAVFDNLFTFKSTTSDIFDDIMIYKTRSEIINDFKLFNLIYCGNLGVPSGDPSFNAKALYYGQYLYATSPCVNNAYIKILKCDINGSWQYVSSCPP